MPILLERRRGCGRESPANNQRERGYRWKIQVTKREGGSGMSMNLPSWACALQILPGRNKSELTYTTYHFTQMRISSFRGMVNYIFPLHINKIEIKHLIALVFSKSSNIRATVDTEDIWKPPVICSFPSHSDTTIKNYISLFLLL